MKKKPKNWVWHGFGILNAYGDPWTHKVFETKEQAEGYKLSFWAGIKDVPDMSKHKIIKVQIKVLPSNKQYRGMKKYKPWPQELPAKEIRELIEQEIITIDMATERIDALEEELRRRGLKTTS